MNSKLSLFILLSYSMLTSICIQATFFSNFPEIKKFALSLDENPPVYRKTWSNPDFSSYSHTLVPGWWNHFLYKFKLKKKSVWSIEEFKDLLIKVTNDRENEGLIERYVVKINPEKGSSFILWGDVQGAFHSLVRTFQELLRRKIINKELQIIKPDHYFVFNGDLINRSAYSLETLSFILRLMDNNPHKVFYIRGNHEDKEHWKNFNLKTDLMIRAASVSNETLPLSKEVSKFFNTLPLALYLIGNENKESVDVVRISHYERDKTELDEEKFKGFFKNNDEEIKTFQLNNQAESTNKKINIRAIIKGESRSTVYRPSPGLSQLEADKGATSWTLFSSPTESYRYLQDFYFDAFAILNIEKKLSDWIITLYNQDIRELFGFKKAATYNLITGLQEYDTHTTEKDDSNDKRFISLQKNIAKVEKEIENFAQNCSADSNTPLKEKKPKQTTTVARAMPKKELPKTKPPSADMTDMVVQNNTVVIGTSIPLERFAKMYGTNIKNGLLMPITDINRRGGVHDKPIRLITLDDEYQPNKTRKNILTLLNDYKTNILLSPFGDPTLEAYEDLIKEKKVLVLFPNSGVGRGLKYVVHLRSSYAQQGTFLVDYAIKNKNARRIAILYQNDIWAKNAVEGAKEALKKHNISESLFVGSERYTLDFSKQAEQIAQFKPDAIGFYVLSIPTKELLSELSVSNLTNVTLFGLDTLSEPRLEEYLKQKGLNMIISNIVPNPKNSEIELVKQYRKDTLSKGLHPNTISLEAYINSSVFVDCLKRLKKPINKDNLLELIENTKNYTLKGLKLNFYNRGLLNTLWLNTGKKDWQEIDLIAFEKSIT